MAQPPQRATLRVLFLPRAAQASFVLARHWVPLSVVSDWPMCARRWRVNPLYSGVRTVIRHLI